RALGFGSTQRIMEAFGENEFIRNTLERDNTNNEEEALVEIYKRLRPGEPPAVESARSLFESLFYDPKRYDLGGVGRYKLNKKLELADRLIGKALSRSLFSDDGRQGLAGIGRVAAVDPNTGEVLGAVVDPDTGEVLGDAADFEAPRAGEKITARKAEVARMIERARHLTEAYVLDADGKEAKILGNGYLASDVKVI
ncbi:MAG TPA: DNA-directed RNA polymerase subunit beta, partial [Firmicutes bacterium]|nr:DNA-directed RNA polymerase subunit beta [Bacillota bacterium]